MPPVSLYPSRCVLKWNCCNDYLTSCLVKNELGNLHSSLLLYCILHYTGSSSVNWLAVSCILTMTLWDTGFKCKSSTRFMCLIINHFVMYYSNPQVNYMVTVFIRLVIAVVYTLHLLSCSKCFVCLCLFQYRHCFLVGWYTNKSYVIATSDLWLFIHASSLLPSTPHPHSPTFNLLSNSKRVSSVTGLSDLNRQMLKMNT